MARLFKATYTVKDKDGQRITKTARRWYVEYTGADGRPRRKAGYVDKGATLQLAAKLERDAERLASGRRDRFDEHLKRPLSEHLADWKQSLLDKGATVSYAELSFNRVKAILDGIGAVLWSDIDINKVQACLRRLRSEGLSIESSNHYTRRIKQFCRWLVNSGRAETSPLNGLAILNARVDRRHDRRALSEDELARLLAVAETGPAFRNLPGYDRAMLYKTAAGSGLRRSELASLTPQSFDLKADPPTVTVRAAYSKHRRDDIQPIPMALAVELRGYLHGKPSGKPVWNIPDRTADMIRLDLRRAKARWIRETQDRKERRERRQSFFLAYMDDAGRYADFHALRHSYVSALAMGGVNPRVAQSLARHSTITLTMDRYAHLSTGDATRALDALPDLTRKPSKPDIERLRATGTENIEPFGRKLGGLLGGFSFKTRQDGSTPCKADGDTDANKGQSEASTKANKDRGFFNVMPDNSTLSNDFDKMRVLGLEPRTHGLKGRCRENVTNDRDDTSNRQENPLAEYLAFFSESWPDLAQIIEVWPDLPEATRAAIVGMVNGSKR